MVSSNSAKVFFISFLAFTLFSSCGWWQKAENKTLSPTPFVAQEIKSGIPFTTAEPENFQAEFVLTTGETEDKTFAARSGDNRRYDFGSGQKSSVSVVQTADNKSYLIFRDKKIYAENFTGELVQDAENPFDFLTAELLGQKADAKFEALGAEGGALKYRASLGENQLAESIIWVDENNGLPVKQEFYSTNSEQRTLNFTFEMKNFKPQAEAGLFEIPKDFRKVSVEEFRRISQVKN